MTNPNDIQHRLLFVLHRAFVEIRLLAQASKMQQVRDLADALEPLPGCLVSWNDEYLDEIRCNLATYAAKYVDAFSYVDFIDTHAPPATF